MSCALLLTNDSKHLFDNVSNYLEEVETLDDVDAEDDVDTELDVETLKWKQVVVMKIHVLWIDTAMIWLPERSNIPFGSYIAKLSKNLDIFVVKNYVVKCAFNLHISKCRFIT